MLTRSEALSQVEQIRQQLARAQAMGAFRALSTGATGLLALAGGLVQAIWSLNRGLPFVTLWLVIAAGSVLTIAVEMTLRYFKADSTLARDNMIVAVGSFLPCIVAGGLLAFVMVSCAAPADVRLLPGLWSILFALGMVAARPGLPRAANFVVGYYLLVGIGLIALNAKTDAIWAGSMPLSFGVGQLLSAIMLARQGRSGGQIGCEA